ncbi:MAG: DUF3280 domain-containing protein [Hyphomicrobium sp.]|nr:DUF3280 domain-containing protein [Hyphomicrobium sp.]
MARENREERLSVKILSSALAGLIGAVAFAVGASAAPKTVVFPFDLSIQKTEEDFFTGPKKASDAEALRLAQVHAELQKLLGGDGRYELVDLAPIAADISKQAPLDECNGCAQDLAKKVGGEIGVTGLVTKASETLLNMQIGFFDVASGNITKQVSVQIQGNTDESWLRGVRWLYKNRLMPEAKP